MQWQEAYNALTAQSYEAPLPHIWANHFSHPLIPFPSRSAFERQQPNWSNGSSKIKHQQSVYSTLASLHPDGQLTIQTAVANAMKISMHKYPPIADPSS